MKNNWEMKRLGEVYDVRDGTHDSPKYYKEGFPLITSKNLKEIGLNFDNIQYISEKDYLKINERSKVDKGDVLFAMIGTIGNPVIVETELKFAIKNVALFKVPKNQNSGFLKYYLDSNYVIEKMKNDSKGTTQKFVGLGYLRDFPICIPSLPDQQRIVAILDESFADIAKAKENAAKNLQNAREIFESYLQSVFANPGDGWEEKPLVELCDSRRIITYGVIKLGNEIPEGVPCLRTSNVRWLYIDTDGIKRISHELSSQYSRTILQGGEVLVNVRGTLGGVAVVTKEMIDWNVSREIAVVPIDSSLVNPSFLCYLIGSGASQKWLSNVKKGAAYTGINLEDLRQLPVRIPNKNIQVKIVQHLELLQKETKKLETIYNQKLTDLEELQKSILQRAFSGNL